MPTLRRLCRAALGANTAEVGDAEVRRQVDRSLASRPLGLVSRVRQGEERATLELRARIARVHRVSEEEALDVLAWLLDRGKLEDYEGRGPLDRWLRWAGLDHRYTRNREVLLPFEILDSRPNGEDESRAVVERRLDRGALRHALMLTSPEHARVLIRRYWCGLTHAEIAEWEGRGYANAGRRLMERARAHLRRLLPVTRRIRPRAIPSFEAIREHARCRESCRCPKCLQGAE